MRTRECLSSEIRSPLEENAFCQLAKQTKCILLELLEHLGLREEVL